MIGWKSGRCFLSRERQTELSGLLIAANQVIRNNDENKRETFAVIATTFHVPERNFLTLHEDIDRFYGSADILDGRLSDGMA